MRRERWRERKDTELRDAQAEDQVESGWQCGSVLTLCGVQGPVELDPACVEYLCVYSRQVHKTIAERRALDRNLGLQAQIQYSVEVSMSKKALCR